MTELGTFAILWVAIMSLLALVRLGSLERRATTVSRIEGKVDALLRHAGIEFNPYDQISPAIVDALRRGEKIEAIKLYRETTSAGLREAKDYIEELQRRTGTTT